MAGYEGKFPGAGPRHRASHADREHVVALLQAAFVEGRLTKDELDARLDRALASRTYAELAALIADIPGELASRQLVREPAAGSRGLRWVATAAIVVLLASMTPFIRMAGPPTAVAGPPTWTARPLPAGVPPYYVQQSFSGPPGPATVVRATATGAIRATVRCPWGQENIDDIAAASDQTFFMVCHSTAREGANTVVTGSRIYRFYLTSSGRIGGYSPVHGGTLAGLQAAGLAVAADGSKVAVTIAPSAPIGTVRFAEIMVINTRTGAHALWHNAPSMPGHMTYGLADLSLTADGSELAFLGIPRCPTGRCTPTGNGEEVRAVSPAGRGGNLSSSRLLVRESALVPLGTGYINGAVISPDGSSVAVLAMNNPDDNIVSVAQVSASTGRQLSVRYKADTGDGFDFQFFGADPSGRYLLLDAGPTSGTVNGWINDGRLFQLAPANGPNVSYEAW